MSSDIPTSDDSNTKVKRIRREAELKVIGTHSGTFHCDEALACYLLRQLPEYENARIYRSRDNKLLKENCDIIVDVGGEFNHKLKFYDHHQKSFQETLSSVRPDVGTGYNIRLSSAGLIYAFYGEQVIKNLLKKHLNIELSEKNLQLTFVQVYKGFISEIDAIDNGIPMYEGDVGEPLYQISTHVSARVGKLNPPWDEESDANINQDERFEKAIETVGLEFKERALNIGGSWVKARDYVRNALEKAKSNYETGEILLLERFCPWKVHLADLEKEYNVEGIPKLVIFAENETSWRVAGVPVQPNSFLGRKFLPAPWRGLANDELSQVADIPDLVFVHHSGFIGGAKTKESALRMAIKSVQWKDNDSELILNADKS